MPQPILPLFGELTVATLDLLPLDGHLYEVIDGELHILPAEPDPHDAIVAAIRAQMTEYANAVGLTVSERRTPIQFSDRRKVYPDLIFTPRSDSTVAPPPALIIEVSTRWTRNTDWNIKPELYDSEGVAAYWIIDLDVRYAIVRRRGEEKAMISHDSINWHPEATRNAFELNLQPLFGATTLQSTPDFAELLAESEARPLAESNGRFQEWTVRMIDVTPDDGCRYEVFDGRLSITPIPPLIHQRVLGDLLLPLHEYSELHSLGFIMGPIGVAFGPRTLVQPDLVAYRTRFRGDDEDERRMREVPILIVEILAPYTMHLDRRVKRSLYRREGVPEYWIVDIEARAVERWLPESTAAAVIRDTLTWQPIRNRAALAIDLAGLFRHLHGH